MRDGRTAHAAKDAQAHNELEIMELEAMLKNVVIIDETHTDGKTVTMGSIVDVYKRQQLISR